MRAEKHYAGASASALQFFRELVWSLWAISDFSIDRVQPSIIASEPLYLNSEDRTDRTKSSQRSSSRVNFFVVVKPLQM